MSQPLAPMAKGLDFIPPPHRKSFPQQDVVGWHGAPHSIGSPSTEAGTSAIHGVDIGQSQEETASEDAPHWDVINEAARVAALKQEMRRQTSSRHSSEDPHSQKSAAIAKVARAAHVQPSTTSRHSQSHVEEVEPILTPSSSAAHLLLAGKGDYSIYVTGAGHEAASESMWAEEKSRHDDTVEPPEAASRHRRSQHPPEASQRQRRSWIHTRTLMNSLSPRLSRWQL